ncbi:hypothetical protein ALC53_13095, partial [Atta colombica]
NRERRNGDNAAQIKEECKRARGGRGGKEKGIERRGNTENI